MWTCSCAKCKRTWKSTSDEIKCPYCKSKEGMCAQDKDDTTPSRQSHRHMSDQSPETLMVSSDGKFLLDSTGKRVKQYLESAQGFVPMSVKGKNGIEFNPANATEKGHIGGGHDFYPCNPHSVCCRWDKNGKCIGTYTTWDICWHVTEDDIINKAK